MDIATLQDITEDQILRVETDTLTSMINELTEKLEELQFNLRKLTVVRDAIAKTVSESSGQLEFEIV
jgi:hypothetical protein